MSSESPEAGAETFRWLFTVVGLAVIIAGFILFLSESPTTAPRIDANNFIYMCLLGLAAISVPWITAVRVKGILEIERKIDTAKNDTKAEIIDTREAITRDISAIRLELSNSMNSLQTQTVRQTAGAQVIIDQSRQLLTAETLDRAAREVEPPETREVEPSESGGKDLISSFAKAAAIALRDTEPPLLRCAGLLRQIHEKGATSGELQEQAQALSVDQQQISMLFSLGMIKTDDDKVLVTGIGRQYFEYWRLEGIREALQKISPIIVETFISKLPSILSFAATMFTGGVSAGVPEKTEPNTSKPDMETTQGEKQQ